jgi:hypothetical protein
VASGPMHRVRRKSARCRAHARAPRFPWPAWWPAHQPGKAGEVFGQHRVALVRHGGRALLARREILFGFQHLGALQVAHFRGQPLDRRGDDAERGEEHRVAVARDHLRGDRLGFRPMAFATCSSTRGSILAKVPTAPEIAQVATSLRALTQGAACSGRTRHRPAASFRPKVVGSAWMPWLRPMVSVSLCS